MSENVISIITVCYNALDLLKRTFDSIHTGDLVPIEHIIIDGQSTDGTQEYLNHLTNKRVKWISEPDNGIYDAMNKGLKLAKGEYVIFMNAGDRFYSQETISKLIAIIQDQSPDIIFGKTMLVNSSYEKLGLRSNLTTRKLPETLKWNDMIYGMLVCHQSFVARRGLAPLYILDNLSADIDWQIKCLKRAKVISKFDGIIAQYLEGGVSQQKHLKSLIDRFLVMKSHYGILQTIISHIHFTYRAVLFNLSSKWKKS